MSKFLDKCGFKNLKSFDILFGCVWTLPILMYNLRGMVSRFAGKQISDLFLPFIFSLLIVLSIRHIIKFVHIIDLFFFFACLGYFYLCYCIYPENRFLYNDIADRVLLQSLPIFFIGLYFDIEKNYQFIRSLSIICLILKVASIFLLGGIGESGESSDEMEAMSTAHHVLPNVLILIWGALKYGGRFNLIIGCFAIIFMLSLGNRGALFAIVFFVALYIFLFKDYIHPIRDRILITITSFATFLLLKPIMIFWSVLFASFGMSTRIFAKFIEDNIADDNGRGIIHDNVMWYVDNGSFWGYGIAGDRNLGGLTLASSHNILLEMMITFGKFCGVLLFVVLCILLLRALIIAKDYLKSEFLLLLISVCSTLWFSGSFIQTPIFFFLIGYCINCNRTCLESKKYDEI